jgi:two-component system, chemotaxis family, sensor kinase Cph1
MLPGARSVRVLSAPYAQHNAECDSEPIHVPGAIQPHGVLFVVEPGTLRITQASANVAAHLGIGDALGRSLSEVIGQSSSERLIEAVNAGSFDAANPLQIVVRGQSFDAILHRNGGATIVELEPVADAAGRPLSRYTFRQALMALQSVTRLGDLEQRVIEQVKSLTGFERVMLYRFDEEGYGHVSAELKEAGLESYLGVHYPASDIPRQARELYMRHWLRIIPDAAYDPVPILPELRADTNAPLDLSCAVLRSVSPVHREYLRNMGVAASMSVSLVVRGRLWGLVSCTSHRGPHRVRYEARSACEVLARLASLQLEALEEREAVHARQARRGTEEALVAAMRGANDELDVLERLMRSPVELMSLVRAEGVAVAVEDRCITHGEAPSPAFVRKLCEWLDCQGERTLFTTASLPSLLPLARDHKDRASGLMTIALPGPSTRRLFWFRPERIRTVSWGGDPRKAVESGAPGERPHPRRSFEIWKEEVRERSLPWSTSGIEAAASLRRYAIEIDLERQVARERRAVSLREEMMAVLSHDLKGFLSVVDMQATLLLQGPGSDQAGEPGALHDTANRIKRSVERMNALINNLLDLARIETGEFSLNLRTEDAARLVEEALLTLSPLADAKGIVILQDIQDRPRVRVDRERFFQVLANLVGNAVKFTPEGGAITVRAARNGGEVVFSVSDSGPGIAPEHLPHIFDRYWRTGGEGEGLGLFVVKSIVEAHGGRAGVVSPSGQGATFEFTVPSA